MKFLTASKIFLISIFPIVLFLLMLDFVVFDESFYEHEFLKYGVEKNIPNAISMHEMVINFIAGKNIELSKEFNEREKQHLWDVRKLVNLFKIALYVGIILFFSLFFASLKILKSKNNIINFIGNVLLYGGLLAIFLAGILFFLVNSNFSNAFESLHRIFFEKGTYAFDPSKEIIVVLYPEQLFMDLGIRMAKFVVFSSFITIFLGILLKYIPKNKKNKKS